MCKVNIESAHGRIEVMKDQDLIYLTVFGEFTDADVIRMTEYLDELYEEIGGPTIRVWDGTHLKTSQFKVTSQGTELLRIWAERKKMRFPNSAAYFISNEPHIFGVSRMYELKTADENMTVSVVKSFDELPEELKERIRSISP